MSSEQFAELYAACDAATKPVIQGIEPADWWRAFLLFTYMTGWRVSEPLKLVREDLDVVNGFAITRVGDNKGGKESRVPLRPIVIEHLERIKTFSNSVFPWPDDQQQLWPQLHLIQAKAGIQKICRKDHEHSDSYEWFGFHDLRRGFATANAGSLTASRFDVRIRVSQVQKLTLGDSKMTTTDWVTSIIEQIADQVYERISKHLGSDAHIFGSKLTCDEQESADILGIPRYVLKGCRERGEITPRKIGKKWDYTRDILCKFALSMESTSEM